MGEGGAVTTNDPGLAARLQAFRSHGMTRAPEEFTQADLAFDADGRPNPWYYEMPEPGFNYRATDMQCALGRSQLAKLARFAATRLALSRRYDELLADWAPVVAGLRKRDGLEPALHLHPVLIDFKRVGLDRAAVMNRLRSKGIGTQVHYIPVHLQPYYRQRYGAASLPGADSYYARCLSLPLFAGMVEADVDRTVEALGDVLGIGNR